MSNILTGGRDGCHYKRRGWDNRSPRRIADRLLDWEEAVSATLVSFATYQAILRMREAIANWEERDEANRRLSQYRCEELYRRLRGFGLSIETAEKISEAVWDVPTPLLYKKFHRSSQLTVVGFKR